MKFQRDKQRNETNRQKRERRVRCWASPWEIRPGLVLR